MNIGGMLSDIIIGIVPDNITVRRLKISHVTLTVIELNISRKK